MPDFTLRWVNRSNSVQDWTIYLYDSFQLQPDYERRAAVTINNDYTWHIAVDTNGRYAAARLTYTASNQTWVLQSYTPNEWELVTGNGTVTVRCLLEDASELPKYIPSSPVQDNEDAKTEGIQKTEDSLKGSVLFKDEED